ncbi:MAG: glycosyltransferase [Nitrospirota bacterium]|nr:glycosyltransferase [Nitrospirota bacterium]
MTRVLHIRSSAGFFGAERVLSTLLPALTRSGVSTRLLLLGHPAGRHTAMLERARDAGIDVVVIPCPGRVSPEAARRVRAEARRYGAQLIHTHDFKSHFYGWIAAGSTGSGRLPLVTTLHGWTGSSVRLRAYQKFERWILGVFAAVVAVSPEMVVHLRHPYLCIIGNGVDLDRFSPDRPGIGRTALGFSVDTFLFGTVARLTREKGHQDLIEAFAAAFSQVPTMGLLIAGDGPERPLLEKLVQERGCDGSVRFTGDCGNVEGLLHDLDCYVSPSHTEGMPMILLEAMASGVPVIATRVGSVPDMLAGGAGDLVEPQDTGQLASRMLLAAVGKLPLERMAGTALLRCEKEYGVERQAARYAFLYQEVLRRELPPAGLALSRHSQAEAP